MAEIYSNGNDCYELLRYLNSKLGKHFNWYGSSMNPVITGEYSSDNELDLRNRFRDRTECVNYHIKYNKDGFLRVAICNNPFRTTSMGEKLAALSSFYQALEEKFDAPTFYYEVDDDIEGTIGLQWSLVNKKEDINKLNKGCFFDDAILRDFIVIDNKDKNVFIDCVLTKKYGLPSELSDIIDNNIDEYLRFKSGSPKENDGKKYSKNLSNS